MFWRDAVGRRQVLMDVDVVGEVFIVVDRRKGVAGDVVEVDEVAVWVLLNSIVLAKEVLTFLPQPRAIFDEHRPIFEVHLNVQGLEQWPSHQQWRRSINHEGLHVATLAVDVDRKPH